MERTQDHGHIRALDGIRGLAILLVFLFHGLVNTLRLTSPASRFLQKIAITGWVGVDLFFVLSGFLITTILLDARKAENYYAVFYGRRLLRIFPLYYLVLFTALMLEPGHNRWPRVMLYWLNLSNLPTAFNMVPLGYFLHFWSLAIEEQFYLVWPWLVRSVTPRTLGKSCVAVIVGVFILKNIPQIIHLNDRWPEFIYRLTPFRIDTLCAGALLAIVVHSGVDLGRYRPHLRGLCVASGLVFLFTSFGQARTLVPVIRFGYTSLVLCAVALVALALFPNGWISKFMNFSFLRLTGKYSYSFYLFHLFLLDGVAPHLSAFHAKLLGWHVPVTSYNIFVVLVLTAEFGIVFAASAVSWRFFESPILRLKRHFRYRPVPERYLA